MRMSAMIKIENVSKVYGKGKKNQVQALKSIDLELEQGHNYAIIGKSGSGKSTLMNMIGLLDLPTEGKIFFKGSDISHYNAGQQAKYRNMEVGFVYQDFRLIDELTAKENRYGILSLPYFHVRIGRKREAFANRAFRWTKTACRNRKSINQ